MAVVTETIRLQTAGNAEVVDITPEISRILSQNTIQNGIVTVCVVGSTGAITTCEYEPGLVQDIPEIMDKLIPAGSYKHDQTWHDGNGHSHLRASLIGPSVTIPFKEQVLIIGTWQQIIFIDFDNRPRDRKITVQIIGD